MLSSQFAGTGQSEAEKAPERADPARLGREANLMADGLSRRDLIKRSAIAGAVAWTAPVLLSMGDKAGAQTTTQTCAGVKIPSCSAINAGKVALCGSFETDNPANFES